MNFTTANPTQINRVYITKNLRINHNANSDVMVLSYKDSLGGINPFMRLDGDLSEIILFSIASFLKILFLE